MFGIDVSSWQGNLKLKDLQNVEFVIAKATEGQGLVDRYCDNFIEQTKKLNLPWGFYHFAKNNSGKFDADYFYRNTKNYFGYGLPVLDYEDPALLQSGKGVAYCEAFVDYIHAKTGVWSVMYMSASVCQTFKGSWIPSKCALWVAGYPRKYTSFVNVDMPYNVSPWTSPIIWQFSGSGRLTGYNGNIDLDNAYINRAGWNCLVQGKPISKGKSHNENILAACRVILGEYGNGQARVKMLESLGYNYDEVQTIVNEILNG